MKIVRTRLPHPASAGRAVLNALADSWYEKGLNVKDLADLVRLSEKHAGQVLDSLVDDGLVEVKSRESRSIGYVLTDKARELLRAESDQV